jgi:hypothetical protein
MALEEAMAALAPHMVIHRSTDLLTVSMPRGKRRA